MYLGRKRSSLSYDKWQYEDSNHLLKSFIGSVIDFTEKCGSKQRVVGVLDNCQPNCYHLIDTYINGEYFGDYVINDYEIYKWRLKEFHEKDKPIERQTNRTRTILPDKSTKYLIPNRCRNGVEDVDVIHNETDELFKTSEVETIDINEDDKPVVVNVKNLTQKASNKLLFINEIRDNFEDVIRIINSSHCVGFELFGDDISREGSVDLMSFATSEAIYVFDAKNPDIISGLKPLIESLDLQKVMFALRKRSDALYHLFDIKLQNAIDVRIWDYHVQKKAFCSNRMAGKPELRSLQKILHKYIGIYVPNPYRKVDFRHFSVRVENLVLMRTIFLRELLTLMNHTLLDDAFRMNNRCLNSLRSAEGLEYIAVRDDEREQEIIESPGYEYEEIERKIISIASFRPINDFKYKEVVLSSDEEVVISSDNESD